MPNYPHPDHVAEIHRRIVAAAGEGGTPDFGVTSVAKHTSDLYGDMPHPQATGLKVKEYPAYERVAWMLHDRQPNGDDVAHTAETLRQAGISPSEFESTWSVARGVANRLLGQDPTIVDVQRLKGASPMDIHAYYRDHPFPGYEEVSAGDMARYYRAAEPIARQYGLVPQHNEVARFAVAGYDEAAMHDHYGSGQ